MSSIIKQNKISQDENDDPSALTQRQSTSKEWSTTFEQPSYNDVICARGSESRNHPGNIKYRQLVEKYCRVYMASTRKEKMRIVNTVKDSITNSGGRFVKQNKSTGYWTEIKNAAAREKTSQSLREHGTMVLAADERMKNCRHSAPGTLLQLQEKIFMNLVQQKGSEEGTENPQHCPSPPPLKNSFPITRECFMSKSKPGQTFVEEVKLMLHNRN